MRTDNIKVHQMLEDMKAKAVEIKKLYDTLAMLKQYGGDFELPELSSLLGGSKEEVKPADAQIRADTFFGMGQTDATEKYLKMVGHAASIDDIYSALAAGGVEFTANGRANLNMMLTRATRRFARIPGHVNSYGLLEWYPKRKKSLAGKVIDIVEENTEEDVKETTEKN